MFEDKSTEQIKAALLARMGEHSALSTMPGSFADWMVGPIAEALCAAYQTLPGIVSMLFVDKGSGPFIDEVARQYWNLIRKPGTRAEGIVFLTGEAGVQLPEGTAFLSAEGFEFRLCEQVTIGSTGTGEGKIQAALEGSDYNLPALALVSMYVNPLGLHHFASSETQGGTDTESDAAFLARLDERRKRPPTSGNAYHYRAWAMEIAGIGGAKVVQLAFGAGTVGIQLIDANDLPPTTALVEQVRANIESQRPIGAGVTIRAAGEHAIALSAQLYLLPGFALEEVRAAFLEALEAYRREVICPKYERVYPDAESDTDYLLLYKRVSALLITTRGVQNYNDLLLNGTAEDILIGADDIPIFEEVQLSTCV